ncbi:MAG TPA: Rap1a/Tai family immunity protein [Xanthobacteraceae bacterium]|nr:Rap1a/Tai family immunity protein [Xanthobacteraceae bacterium]
MVGSLKWLVVAMFVTSTGSYAQQAGYSYNGVLVRTACESNQISRQQACNAYISAVADVMVRGTLTLSMPDGKIRTERACVPAESDFASLRKIVLDWLDRNTNYELQNGVTVVALALSAAFPCR